MEAGEFREDRPTPVGASAELTEMEPMRLARSPWQLFWRRFRDDKLALASLIFLAVLILVAIFAPFVVKLFGAPADYNYRDTAALDPLFATPPVRRPNTSSASTSLAATSSRRTIYGARVSLVVAFASTILATTLGVVAGLLAGYFRGWTDTFISRSIEVLLAIPYLLLATGLAAACTLGGAGCLGGLIKPGLGVVIFVIAITELDLHGAHRPRPDAVTAREGVRRGLAGGRRPATSGSSSASCCRT